MRKILFPLSVIIDTPLKMLPKNNSVLKCAPVGPTVISIPHQAWVCQTCPVGFLPCLVVLRGYSDDMCPKRPPSHSFPGPLEPMEAAAGDTILALHSGTSSLFLLEANVSLIVQIAAEVLMKHIAAAKSEEICYYKLRFHFLISS